MTPEDVRGLQCQISDALRDRASRIRNGNDLATVRKVLSEVQESAAEWLRQTGSADEAAHGWIQTTDRLPTAADHHLGPTHRHVPCLAVTFLRPRETEFLQWDLRCQCWNDRNGRPFTSNPGDVICWMPLPAPPAEEASLG